MKFISIINVSGMHLESRNSHHFWAVSTERSWNRRICALQTVTDFFFIRNVFICSISIFVEMLEKCIILKKRKV